MGRAALADDIAAVGVVCRRLGLGEVAPTLLHAGNHTTLRLASLGLIARVQSGGDVAVARSRADREVAVARHLATHRAPAIAALAGGLAGPHVVGAAVVTLWPNFADARVAGDDDGPLAAATLAAVHRALADYAGPLPPYTAGLDRCRRVLDDPATPLSAADRALLTAHYCRLRADLASRVATGVALHGDVHLGNLLVARDDARWTDFEDACRGPREFDLAGLPAAVWPADADHALIRRCAEMKSVCVAVWCTADAERSPALREAAEYHLAVVRALPLAPATTDSPGKIEAA